MQLRNMTSFGLNLEDSVLDISQPIYSPSLVSWRIQMTLVGSGNVPCCSAKRRQVLDQFSYKDSWEELRTLMLIEKISFVSSLHEFTQKWQNVSAATLFLLLCIIWHYSVVSVCYVTLVGLLPPESVYMHHDRFTKCFQ